MNARTRETNQEKSRRIMDLLPLIFKSGYIGEQGILTGGVALNLEFPNKRFATDIDLKDVNTGHLDFRRRFDYFADELRKTAESNGYHFKIGVEKSPRGKLYYINANGEEDRISIDVALGNDVSFCLEPLLKSYPGVGEIRVLPLEEMLGRKISMLSRPRLRGHKRYSDLLDVYNSLSCGQLDDRLLKAMFVYAMTLLGVRICPTTIKDMLDWHDPSRFQSGIESKTNQEVQFQLVRDTILARYASLCRLTAAERDYNQGKTNQFELLNLR